MPQFKLQATFKTELGATLADGLIHYECIGNPKGEVIWVCHALTGSATVKDWWPTIFSENGGFIDLNKHYVICANSIGSCYGSTGPTAINNDFPVISHRDVVHAFHLLKAHIGIEKIDVLIGGSLGGQQALEWTIAYPNDINFAVLIACNAWHSSWGIAWNELQRNAIELDTNENGLSLARKIAMLSYRSSADFEQKTRRQNASNDDIVSYLQYQGDKFIKRFNKASYYFLTQMMDAHNISKTREKSVEELLKSIQIPTLVFGISSDILFPIVEQELLSANIPNAQLSIIESDKGHDAFLLEGNFISQQIQKHFSDSALTI